MMLHQMEFYGYHGVLGEENLLGQKFIVDLTVELDLKKPGETDDLRDSISYVDLYHICQGIVENSTFKLIEKVAEVIAETVLNKVNVVNTVIVKVVKPNPPIRGHFHYVAVEIVRTREV